MMKNLLYDKIRRFVIIQNDEKKRFFEIVKFAVL